MVIVCVHVNFFKKLLDQCRLKFKLSGGLDSGGPMLKLLARVTSSWVRYLNVPRTFDA